MRLIKCRKCGATIATDETFIQIANDVVPVVRCKDCAKAVRHEVFPWSRRCKVEDRRFSHKAEHFCSYGERKEQ